MAISPTPPQNWLLEINRNLLVYLFIIFLNVAPATLLLTGRLDQSMTDASGSVVWQIIELFAFANCILIARNLGVKGGKLLFSMLPLLGLLLWAMLSVTWSEYPDLTTRRASRLIVEVTAAVILALSFSTSQGILRTFFRIFFVINLADVLSVAMPSISQTSIGFAGVHGHKNLAGEFFYMAMPVFFIGILDRSISRNRAAAFFAFVTAAGMLLASQSKTAIGTGLVATAFVLCSRVAQSKRYRILLICFSPILLFALVLLIFLVDLSDIINIVFGDPTLSGRDRIWQYTISKFESGPLGGVGYGALWSVGPRQNSVFADWQILGAINEAHNGYLDILSQTGVVGLLLLVAFLLMSSRSNLSVCKFFGRAQRLVGRLCNIYFLGWPHLQCD